MNTLLLFSNLIIRILNFFIGNFEERRFNLFMDLVDLKKDLKMAISGIGAVDKDTYLMAIKRIDSISKDSSLPKQLQHFLSRRSYHKANDFLEASYFEHG